MTDTPANPPYGGDAPDDRPPAVPAPPAEADDPAADLSLAATSDEDAYDAWLDAHDAALEGAPSGIDASAAEPASGPELVEVEPDTGDDADLGDEEWDDADWSEDEDLTDEDWDDGELPAATQEPTAEPRLPDEGGVDKGGVTDAASDVGGAEDSRVGRRLLVTLSVLVAVLVAGCAVAVGATIQTRGPGPVEQARGDAVEAARGAARLVFSYDYRHLDQDFAAGRATTTGAFQAEYDRTTGKIIRDVAPRYKAVVVADVSDVGVVTASTSRVLVLVFLDQQSTSTLATQPKITQSRLEMTMVKVGGHWLVDKIHAF